MAPGGGLAITRRAFLCLTLVLVASLLAGVSSTPDEGEDMSLFHKVKDITGRSITGKWDIGGTDLGAAVTMPNGELLVVLGDTFSNDGVGGPGWRSPVGLIGHLDDQRGIRWDRAAGPNPHRAEQFWPYIQGGSAFSTVLPSDVVTVGDKIYGHFMVNKGLGNVLWTEVRVSHDNGKSWDYLYKIDGWEDDSQAQLWAWDYSPDEHMIYAYTTRFNRDEGMRMRRIPADKVHDKGAWEKWGYVNGQWQWGGVSSVILPGRFGESSLRRLDDGTWVWATFDAGNYRIDVRVLEHPTANLHATPVHTVVRGSAWNNEDHSRGRVAQLYGAYVVPGSQVGKRDGFDLIVSQWNTSNNQVYKSMQFRGTVPALPGAVDGGSVERPEKVNPFIAFLLSLLGK